MKTDRLKVLLIVPPLRKDFYSYLSNYEEADFYILWFVKSKEAAGIQLPDFIKGQYFWGDYSTPKELLKEISPSRIVFFEIIDQRQIALIVAAKHYKYPTFYLEHGAAGNKESAALRSESEKIAYLFFQRIPRLIKRFSSSIDAIKVKRFYLASSYLLKGASREKYLRLPIRTLISKPNKALAECQFPERIPDKCILFNHANFEEFQWYTGVREDNVIMEGVPFFDKFYSLDTSNQGPVIYIDHPLLESKLWGWTNEHHRKIALALFEFASSNKQKLIVKLHPVSSLALWQSYNLESEYFQIVQSGDFTKQYLESRLILGFSSSLINGFLCAKKNVVLLAWHPEPGIYGPDFSETGLCHLSLFPEDLKTKYVYWVENNPTKENEIAYENFLKQYNSPFDGKATERVINAIMRS